MACDPETLKQFLESSGLSYKTTGSSYVFNCPKCNSQKLYIRRTDGRFVCWKCKETENFQGKPEFALSELLNTSVKSIAAALYEGDTFDPEVFLDIKLEGWKVQDDEIIVEKPVQAVWPIDYYPIDHEHAQNGLEYVRNRGITLNIAKHYGIRYCPGTRSIYYPISSNGWLFGWQSRRIDNKFYIDETKGEIIKFAKSLTSEGLKKDQLLMFSDQITANHVVLCEGPMDAIHAHFCGGNVATMGKAVSRQQIALIRNNGIKKVYLALDPDAASEIERLCSEFEGLEIYDMVPQEDKDLGDIPLEEVYGMFLDAKPMQSGKLWIFLDDRVF